MDVFSNEYYKEKIMRLNQIGILISKEKDIDKLLDMILTETVSLTNSDAGSIYIREDIDGEDLLVFKHAINQSSDFKFTGKTIDVNHDSISGHVTLTGETIVLNEIVDDKLHIDKTFDLQSNYITKNMIVVPMKNELDKVVGIFQILNKTMIDKESQIEELSKYDFEDVDLVSSLASQSAILIERIRLNKMLERNISLTRTTLIRFYNNMKDAMSVIGDDILKEQEEFKELATYDELTGLLSRKEGLSYIEKIIEFSSLNGMTLVLAFIDINDLKTVNDTYGHHEGDYLIKSIVGIITKVAREGDFMIRFGGDEFLLCISNADLLAASKMKFRIDRAFREFNENSNKEYPISASFGFAEYDYKNKQTLEEIIEIADQRMYKEKQEYKKNRKD